MMKPIDFVVVDGLPGDVGDAHRHRPRPRTSAHPPDRGRDRQRRAARAVVARRARRAARDPPRIGPVGMPADRRTHRRLRWAHDARAPVPAARPRGRTPAATHPGRPSQERPPVARVDFLFEEAGVVVEVSGRHGTRARRNGPATRSAATNCRTSVDACYEYTWEDVTERPAFVAGPSSNASASRLTSPESSFVTTNSAPQRRNLDANVDG